MKKESEEKYEPVDPYTGKKLTPDESMLKHSRAMAAHAVRDTSQVEPSIIQKYRAEKKIDTMEPKLEE